MKVYSPKRKQYKKILSKQKECFFCTPSIVRKQECTLFSYNHWNVLVNKYPYMDGNVMLVPKRHIEKIEEMLPEEWKEFSEALLRVKKVLEKKFETPSFNIGINIGNESGRSVAHLHWQIIPRKKKNHTVVGVLADIHVVETSPQELKKMLSKRKESSKGRIQ